MKPSTRRFWKDFFALLMPFWRSKEKWPAIGLLVVIVAFTLGAVFLSVQFSFWYNRFYQALQDYNQPAFWREIAIFAGLATVSVLRGVYATYLEQFLMIRWRRWMTNELLAKWLSNRAYYTVSSGPAPRAMPAPTTPTSASPRTSSDFTQNTLTLGVSFIPNRVHLTSFNFSIILWTLSVRKAITTRRPLRKRPAYHVVWRDHLRHRRHLADTLGRAPVIPLNFRSRRPRSISASPGAGPREHRGHRAIQWRRGAESRRRLLTGVRPGHPPTSARSWTGPTS